jgi:hypothetical protein
MANPLSNNRFAADDTNLPAIPAWLAHLPVRAGMAVPWITARGLDGRYLFGALHPLHQRQAIIDHRCQVCGRRLDHRSILLMRLSDLPRQRTSEPALDPVCAAYTAKVCPMVAGRMRRYRGTAQPLGHGMTASVSQPARLGAMAEPWFAVWLERYRPITEDGRQLASYAGIRPLRIRPITWRQLLPW